MYPTFIYGTPHGFNFYEGVAAWNDYFKGFYVSSRHGRRLMLNRRDDGTTVYSFLCYELMEKEGRPNSFFGCSVVVDGGRYSPDLKTLYEWFDYLMGKLVERGVIFKVNGGGTIQYQVDRFSDAPDEVEWLKANLPNIFTRSSELSMLDYDSSYSARNTGTVACRHIDTDPRKLVDAVRKSHWVALSPGFAPEEELEEVNFADLDAKVNDYNQQLLQIAVRPSADAYPTLTAIEAECSQVMAMLDKYARMTQDDIERVNCREAKDKYLTLSRTLGALKGKMRPATPTPAPKPTPKPKHDDTPKPSKLRQCSKCGRRLPPESFPDADSTLCSHCAKTTREYHKCSRCGRMKPVSAFTAQADVCDNCLRPSRLPAWLTDPLVAGGAIMLIIVAVSALLIYRACDDDRLAVQQGDDKFKVEMFRMRLAGKDYAGAREYAVSGDAWEQYRGELGDSLRAQMVRMLTSRIVNKEQVDRFIDRNSNLLTEAGLAPEEWKNYAFASSMISDHAGHGPIDQPTRVATVQLTDQLPAEIRTYWLGVIAAIPAKEPEVAAGTTGNESQNTPVSFTIVAQNNKDEIIRRETKKAAKSEYSYEFAKGTFVSITSTARVRVSGTSEVINITNGKKIELKDTSVTFSIDNVKITVTPQKNNGFTTI